MAHINAESKDREDVYRYKSGWISKSRSFNSFKSSINAPEQIFSCVGFVLCLKTKDLQDRLQDLRGVTIVVVSATDCIGSDNYNEALSSRRTQKIKKDLAKYGGNNFVLMPVGEKQLIMGCLESDKDKNKQVENRYSYVFVIK